MMGLQQLTGIVLQFEKPSVLLGRTWDWIPNETPLTWFGAHPLILTVVEALVMPSSEGYATVPQRHRRGALSDPSRLPHGLWLGPRRDRGHLVAREAGVRVKTLSPDQASPFREWFNVGGSRQDQPTPPSPHTRQSAHGRLHRFE